MTPSDDATKSATKRPVRIANFSGFYGDRRHTARGMIEGGPVDVITGDYLAELTMLILWKARQRDSSAGYAKTFLADVEEILGTCLDRNIKIVANAGGLNPAGLVEQISLLADRLGLSPRVAYVTGDDILDRVPELQASGIDLAHLDDGRPLSASGTTPVAANVYLGGWGIAEGLAAGADIVVAPRVTDASVVVGPAAWWHGWQRDDWNQLAGAVVAGHVLECGPQVTGGNYPFLDEIVDPGYPGFPIAEIAADGSSVITKHEGTGGLVSIGTVTAQLLYEIKEPAYLNPDVITHFDSIVVDQVDTNRVRLSGTRGGPPPETLKVSMNYVGGYRNTMTVVLTGLDIEPKAKRVTNLLFGLLGGRDQYAESDVRLLRFDHADAESNPEATAHFQITVKDPDEAKVGRRFSDAVIALSIASIAGFHTTTPPVPAKQYGVFWPALIPRDLVTHRVVLPDGIEIVVPHSQGSEISPRPVTAPVVLEKPEDSGPSTTVPLGRLVGARAGDKGGNANVGVWVRDKSAWGWLDHTLTVERFKELIPETHDLEVLRYRLPNLGALNFVVVGLLEEGVASATRPDPQAKGLGEYLRSRLIDVPGDLLS